MVVEEIVRLIKTFEKNFNYKLSKNSTVRKLLESNGNR